MKMMMTLLVYTGDDNADDDDRGEMMDNDPDGKMVTIMLMTIRNYNEYAGAADVDDVIDDDE